MKALDLSPVYQMGTVNNLLNAVSDRPGAAPAARVEVAPPTATTFTSALVHAMNHASARAAGTTEAIPASVNALPGSRGMGAAAQLDASAHSLQERALMLLSKRQELIASNIANADTPNYKAVDIDVPEALRVGYLPSNVPVQYVVPTQSSLDGNTVEMDTERAKFAENTVRYQFALDRVSAHYKMMMELLKNPN